MYSNVEGKRNISCIREKEKHKTLVERLQQLGSDDWLKFIKLQKVITRIDLTLTQNQFENLCRRQNQNWTSRNFTKTKTTRRKDRMRDYLLNKVMQITGKIKHTTKKTNRSREQKIYGYRRPNS